MAALAVFATGMGLIAYRLFTKRPKV